MLAAGRRMSTVTGMREGGKEEGEEEKVWSCARKMAERDKVQGRTVGTDTGVDARRSILSV